MSSVWLHCTPALVWLTQRSTLPCSISSLDSATRRTRIYNTAFDLRRQMIKLYVIAKWSKGSKHMQHLKNVIGLIHEQSYQTVDARDHLSETRTILPNARERNHDVVTAVDVLSSGEPHSSIPARVIKDEAIGPGRITDEEAVEVIRELNQAIRVRLACSEILPSPFQSSTAYQVSDGRVHLRAPDLFHITLTLSGAQEDDRWYLLSIDFDFNVTGPGQNKFPRDLWEIQREGFIANANEILAPLPATTAGEEQDQPHTSLPDAPIVRLYEFLASQALEYQLDILAYQATELSRLRGRDSIACHWEERCFVVKYWNTNQTTTSGKKKWNPLYGGTLKLQVVPSEASSAKERLVRAVTLHAKGESANETTMEKKLTLQSTWHVDERLLIPSDFSSSTPINAQDLNFANIFDRLTAEHTRAAMAIFEERLKTSALGGAFATTNGESKSTSDASGARLTFPLHASLSVSLGADAQTGKMSLDEVSSDSSGAANSSIAPLLSVSPLTSAIREAKTNLNNSPDSLVDILVRLRTLAIRDDLQRKASYVGLPYVRRLNLNQEEYTKVGVQSTQLIYFPLQQSPTWYLFLAIQQMGLSAGVMCAAPLQYGTEVGASSAALAIQSLQWLEMDRLLTSGSSKKRKRDNIQADSATYGSASLASTQAIVTPMQLARLYSYATALTKTAEVEGQLHLRGLPFIYAPPPTSLPESSFSHAEDMIPPISVSSTDLFGGSASAVLCRNVLLKLKEYWNPGTSYIRLTARFKFALPAQAGRFASIDVEQDGSEVHRHSDTLASLQTASSSSPPSVSTVLDSKRSTITLRTNNIAQSLAMFSFAWLPIARVASLANALLSPGLRSAELIAFDLRSVRFRYGEGKYQCTVRWESGLQAMSGGPAAGYVLDFSSTGNDPSPHDLIKTHLESLLNTTSAIPLWPSFLFLLHQTLAVLETLRPTYEEATADDADPFAVPDVIFLSAAWYRIIWREKYKLDVRFVKGAKNVVVFDGTAGLFARSGSEAVIAEQGGEESEASKPITSSSSNNATLKKEVADEGTTAPSGTQDDPIDTDSFLNLDEDVAVQGSGPATSIATTTAHHPAQTNGSGSTAHANDDYVDEDEFGDARIPNLAQILRSVVEEDLSDCGADVFCFDSAILCDLNEDDNKKNVAQKLIRSLVHRFSVELKR